MLGEIVTSHPHGTLACPWPTRSRSEDFYLTGHEIWTEKGGQKWCVDVGLAPKNGDYLKIWE